MLRKTLSVAGFLNLLVFSLASLALAGVPPQEAQRLQDDLTPLGAERAGNADGSIPAWTGGMATSPTGVAHTPGEFYPDPFAGDQVLFSITAANLDQHADRLSEGVKALLKKYPQSFRLDVYPTRRTQAAPDWVYENTYRNATRNTLVEDGLGMEGGYGGIPFPIPHRGEEVMFNHLARWQGGWRESEYVSGLVHPNGTFTEGGGGRAIEAYPYNLKGGSPETHQGGLYYVFLNYQRPARRKGELIVAKDPVNHSDGRGAWQYLPGQRRVRRAPTISYDTPHPSGGAIYTYDDVFLFNGALDRYDWKLVGKREMYIPYNNYQINLVSRDELLHPYHVNPDVLRWELHRVWVVEATLKDGKRHAYAKRIMYSDEDSWNLVLTDSFDGRGNLWRLAIGPSFNNYELPGVVTTTHFNYDLESDSYAASAMFGGMEEYIRFSEVPPCPLDQVFSPENLRRQGRR